MTDWEKMLAESLVRAETMSNVMKMVDEAVRKSQADYEKRITNEQTTKKEEK